MSKTYFPISTRFFTCSLLAFACFACGDGEIAELGIYDDLLHGGKHKRDARVDPGMPAKDAGAPVQDAETVIAPSSDASTRDATAQPPQDATVPTADAGAPATGGSGGASIVPIAYDDPDLKCYKLNAFGVGDRSAPYTVPTTPDFYVAFDLKAPWSGKQYIRSFKSLTDNKAVLVQMLLFKQSAAGAEQVKENALGAHPDGQLLYSFAGGGDDLYFDPDVGLEVDDSVLYQLEIHYNNLLGRPTSDASGFELCVTPNKPAHIAGLSWLGTDGISGSSAQGHCAPDNREPIHLIAAQPRMHRKGKHMKVEITRSSGAEEILHDEDFGVDYQRNYLLNQTMQPGDVANTTCTYSSESAIFGRGVNDEICYFYAIYWPAGGLSSSGVGTIIHGVNSCMDF